MTQFSTSQPQRSQGRFALPGLRYVLSALCLVMMACAAYAGASDTPSSLPSASTTPPALPHSVLPQADYAEVGPVTITPAGWVDFCERYRGECDGGPLEPRDVHLTLKTWREIVSLNHFVNHSITPQTDLEHWGVIDQWDLPYDGKGDCEDYVLLKRKMLMERGFPRQALLVTVVRDEHDEGHAILTVKTDRGEFVLDNMIDDVRAWNDTPYVFVKRQSQSDENIWEQIGDPTDMPAIVSR